MTVGNGNHRKQDYRSGELLYLAFVELNSFEFRSEKFVLFNERLRIYRTGQENRGLNFLGVIGGIDHLFQRPQASILTFRNIYNFLLWELS